MENKSNVTVRLAYLYLSIPVLIFFVSWMRWYVALPAVALLLFGLVSAFWHAPKVWMPEKNKKNLLMILFSALLILGMVYLSGIGKLCFQNSDHLWRNAIFDTLVNYSWPVYDVNGGGNPVSLVYYIGFWLPSALVGKAFGLTAGYLFMAVWAALGVFLFFSLVWSYLKKCSVWHVVLFFLFSGLDVAVHFLMGHNAMILDATSHLEWGIATFQYSSFTTQLFWVFNQAIPAWIIVLLLLLQKDNKHMVFILSLAMLSCTLPFVGMLPIAAYLVFTRKYDGINTRKQWWKTWLKDTFTLPNILAGGATGILSFLYVMSNSRSADSGSEVSSGTFGFVWQSYGSLKVFLINFILFLTLEAALLFLINYKRYKSGLFWVCAVSLTLIPLFTMGIGYDFCMRVSIPALVVLFLMTAQTIADAVKKERWVFLYLVFLCLFIGAQTPLHEIYRSVSGTMQGNFGAAGTFDLMKAENEENFVAEIENTFFYKYLAKPKK